VNHCNQLVNCDRVLLTFLVQAGLKLILLFLPPHVAVITGMSHHAWP
jgi:hypothetical protein